MFLINPKQNKAYLIEKSHFLKLYLAIRKHFERLIYDTIGMKWKVKYDLA